AAERPPNLIRAILFVRIPCHPSVADTDVGRALRADVSRFKRHGPRLSIEADDERTGVAPQKNLPRLSVNVQPLVGSRTEGCEVDIGLGARRSTGGLPH